MRSSDREEAGPTFPPSNVHRASRTRRPPPAAEEPSLHSGDPAQEGETHPPCTHASVPPGKNQACEAVSPGHPAGPASRGHFTSTAPTASSPGPDPGLASSALGPQEHKGLEAGPAELVGGSRTKQLIFSTNRLREKKDKLRRTEKAKRPGWGRMQGLCGQG